jgi:cyclopropane-fatty-acyl-phospholipid synthase
MGVRYRTQAIIAELLANAGVEIGGNRPWDITVHNDRFYRRSLLHGALGFGESYVEGWWDCEALDECVNRIVRAGLKESAVGQRATRRLALVARLANRQSRRRAQRGSHHYDRGNDLFEAMLDPWLQYSCAYWADGDDLAAAQRRKLDLICRKLQLAPGLRMLDIGCGWGGLAAWAAQRHGVEVFGVALSQNQIDLGRERWRVPGVELRLQDYREVAGTFDRIVSVGMLEHVGVRNLGAYFGQLARLLAPDGIALVHTIGSNRSLAHTDPFVDRHIFPASVTPSLTQIGAACEDQLVIEDVHNLGPHYDRTLLAWHANFAAAWPLLASSYGGRFRRLWSFFLLSSAGSFRARNLQVWQFVLTRPGRRQPEAARAR